jgi:pentalenolactone synthase
VDTEAQPPGRKTDVPTCPAVVIPLGIPSPLDEPTEFAELRARQRPTQVRTATGDRAWLLSSYADVRALCHDPRIGKSHPDPAHAPRLWDAALLAPQANHGSEAGDHLRWRQTLNESFSSRSINRLRPRIQSTFDSVLAAFRSAGGPPADLCAGLARPFSGTVISDLIGIPVELRELFMEASDLLREGNRAQEALAYWPELHKHLNQLMLLRRDDPADDLITALVHRAAGPHDGGAGSGNGLQQHEIAAALTTVFFSGFETVASRLSYGVLRLLTDAEAGAALRDNPSLAPGAVEEVMRLAVPGGSWIPRYAQSDLVYRGVRIKAGELVVFSFQSANRDECQFADADRFDINRSPNPHIAFGQGTYFCLGAALTRVELETAFASLWSGLPGLALASPPERLELRTESVTGGLRDLPVTWT